MFICVTDAEPRMGGKKYTGYRDASKKLFMHIARMCMMYIQLYITAHNTIKIDAILLLPFDLSFSSYIIFCWNLL